MYMHILKSIISYSNNTANDSAEVPLPHRGAPAAQGPPCYMYPTTYRQKRG